MKKQLFAGLILAALSASAQEKVGITAAYSYRHGVVLDLTQKDSKGLITGFGGGTRFNDVTNLSAFGVLGYEYKNIEFKGRGGISIENRKGLYGGAVSFAGSNKLFRYTFGYDNHNKFQAGIGLSLK
jgi:hypothetical protein